MLYSSRSSFINLSRSDLQIALWSRFKHSRCRCAKFISIALSHTRVESYMQSLRESFSISVLRASIRLFIPISFFSLLSATNFGVYILEISARRNTEREFLQIRIFRVWFSPVQLERRERATHDANVTARFYYATISIRWREIRPRVPVWLFRKRTRSRWLEARGLECILALHRATMQHPVPSNGSNCSRHHSSRIVMGEGGNVYKTLRSYTAHESGQLTIVNPLYSW